MFITRVSCILSLYVWSYIIFTIYNLRVTRIDYEIIILYMRVVGIHKWELPFAFIGSRTSYVYIITKLMQSPHLSIQSLRLSQQYFNHNVYKLPAFFFLLRDAGLLCHFVYILMYISLLVQHRLSLCIIRVYIWINCILPSVSGSNEQIHSCVLLNKWLVNDAFCLVMMEACLALSMRRRCAVIDGQLELAIALIFFL